MEDKATYIARTPRREVYVNEAPPELQAQVQDLMSRVI